jgi:hypothetical protein
MSVEPTILVEEEPTEVDTPSMAQVPDPTPFIMDIRLPSPVPSLLPTVVPSEAPEPAATTISVEPTILVEEEPTEVDTSSMAQVPDPTPLIMDIRFPSPVLSLLPTVVPSEAPEPAAATISVEPTIPVEEEPTEADTPSMAQVPDPTPLMDIRFHTEVQSEAPELAAATMSVEPTILVEEEPTEVDTPSMAQMPDLSPLTMDIRFPSVVPSEAPEPTAAMSVEPTILVEEEPTEVDTPSMVQVPDPLTIGAQSPSSVPSFLPSEALESVSPGVSTPTQEPKQPASTAPKNFITGLHATIIDDTIPDTLASGSTTSVSLMIANTGSVTWRPDDGIGISAIGDTARYAPEWQNVPVTRTERKHEYILAFSLTAPRFPGEYTFSFQAGRKRPDMTSTFGRPYTKTVLVT